MKKYLMSILVIVFVFLVSSCSNGDDEPSLMLSSSSAINNETIAQPEQEIEVIDYVDIINNSEDYDDVEVTVAGRISDFSLKKNQFYFLDRLGSYESGLGFSVDLAQEFSYNESASDYYGIGEFVVVKGTWYDGHGYSRLKNAEVIDTGEIAKEYADSFMEQWYLDGIECSKTLPITDYMDIVENIEMYNGQRIRTIGKIQAMGTNKATYHIYFSFRDPETNRTSISFSLKGCPQEMQDMCVEDEYIILSGIVQQSAGSLTVSDCFVECVGADAESLT